MPLSGFLRHATVVLKKKLTQILEGIKTLKQTKIHAARREKNRICTVDPPLALGIELQLLTLGSEPHTVLLSLRQTVFLLLFLNDERTLKE